MNKISILFLSSIPIGPISTWEQIIVLIGPLAWKIKVNKFYRKQITYNKIIICIIIKCDITGANKI